VLLFPVGILYGSKRLLANPALGWSLFAAAMTSNQGLRSDLISRVFNRLNNRTISGVFPVYYDASQGLSVLGVAR